MPEPSWPGLQIKKAINKVRTCAAVKMMWRGTKYRRQEKLENSN